MSVTITIGGGVGGHQNGGEGVALLGGRGLVG